MPIDCLFVCQLAGRDGIMTAVIFWGALVNEDKVLAMLVKLAADQQEFRKEVGERLGNLESGQKELSAQIVEVRNQLEGIEAKNLERHAEMRADIRDNKTDIERIKKIK